MTLDDSGRMSLPGPSRTIIVEPVEEPATAPVPEREPATAPEPEPVPASPEPEREREPARTE